MKKVEPDKLLAIIEAYIAKHNVMALATSHGDVVRNTPVEYVYLNDAFYFLSEGGKKFEGLEVNKNVCLAVFDQMTGGICKGLQVTGIAEVIESDSEEYLAYFRHQKNIARRFCKESSLSHSAR